MKILMLSDTYFPTTIGGGPEAIRSLSRGLIKRGHEVAICAIGDKCLPDHDGQIKVYWIEGFFQKVPFLYRGLTAKWPPPTQDWLLTRALRQVIEQEKPDIIHIYGYNLYSVLPLKKELKLPLVATLFYGFICPKANLLRGDTICTEPLTTKCIACARADYGLIRPLAGYLALKLNKRKLAGIDKFIAVSSSDKRTFLPYIGVEDNKVVVIPNFYTPSIGKRTETSVKLPQDFILFVGRLAPIKGVDVLIRTYQKLDLKTKLVVIGASHPRYHYESTENILVIEDAPYSLVLDAYQNCRFTVFPSIWLEPFGIVNLEAMSYRKAIVASNTGGFTDIVVDGDTGILVPPNDTEALAKAMKYLLENPGVANQMGQKGYDRWRQLFTPEAVIPKVEQLYKSLI